MRIIGETHIPFLKYRKLFVTISAIVVGLGCCGSRPACSTRRSPGCRFGIDFTGGTQVLAKFRDTPDLDRLRRALTPFHPMHRSSSASTTPRSTRS